MVSVSVAVDAVVEVEKISLRSEGGEEDIIFIVIVIASKSFVGVVVVVVGIVPSSEIKDA